MTCATSEATVQGAGNLDQDRVATGVEQLAVNSPIITDLSQILIQTDGDCAANIGVGATEYEEAAEACTGGIVDAAGATICAAEEATLLFKGHVFDPQSQFAKKEGVALDAQFFWLTSSEAPVNFTDLGDFGASLQSGFVIPGAGWAASGGPFILAQCLSRQNYPLGVDAYPVTLHFVDTGVGDAGEAGNSFCTEWQP